jgi:3-phenylpropionate/trans-cinnamate dioxygenase ferredoxin reductase component
MIGDEAHRPYDRPTTSKELLSGGLELERVYLKSDQVYTDKTSTQKMQ